MGLTFRRSQGREGVRAPLCQHCHGGLRKPMYAGLAEHGGAEGSSRSVFTWDSVKRLKDATPMKLLVKGIQTREDAELAIAHGVDGIVVSNHGVQGPGARRGDDLRRLPDDDRRRGGVRGRDAGRSSAEERAPGAAPRDLPRADRGHDALDPRTRLGLVLARSETGRAREAALCDRRPPACDSHRPAGRDAPLTRGASCRGRDLHGAGGVQ
ncbi:MAG: alpha-hydroxy-acid oxidizing protein [Acidobacteria bacterium]|nr:alpha-hydroxy-acid oxidizing protein [Acidobacteriota bacterium]MBI3264782.1 alpha-hydroxy-acid oxidizing protein [Acidobacteriota bacterium]